MRLYGLLWMIFVIERHGCCARAVVVTDNCPQVAFVFIAFLQNFIHSCRHIVRIAAVLRGGIVKCVECRNIAGYCHSHGAALNPSQPLTVLHDKFVIVEKAVNPIRRNVLFINGHGLKLRAFCAHECFKIRHVKKKNRVHNLFVLSVNNS